MPPRAACPTSRLSTASTTLRVRTAIMTRPRYRRRLWRSPTRTASGRRGDAEREVSVGAPVSIHEDEVGLPGRHRRRDPRALVRGTTGGAAGGVVVACDLGAGVAGSA